MIEIRDLQFGYPHSSFRLHVEALKISDAAATAVVGASGSGKTTLLHLIAGILVPEAGIVQVNNTIVSQLSDAARRRFRLTQVGMVFQNFELIEYLNVLDNVLLPCRLSPALPLTTERRERALQLLASVGLRSHARRSINRLSQGERQRVAICRALLPQPELVLADEPTGNLDPVTSQQILRLLLDSVRQQNTTLVMVTHDHSLLPSFDTTIDFQQFLAVDQTNVEKTR